MSDLGSFKGLAPIAFESVSAVTATPSVQLGTRRTHQGEDYVYFYNSTGSNVTQGAAMTISALSGYSLTRSTTAGADIAICFVKHADVAAGSYAWGLVRGLVNPLAVSAISAGQLLRLGADGIVATYATVTSWDFGPVGKMVGSSTSSTADGVAYVKCFG